MLPEARQREIVEIVTESGSSLRSPTYALAGPSAEQSFISFAEFSDLDMFITDNTLSPTLGDQFETAAVDIVSEILA